MCLCACLCTCARLCLCAWAHLLCWQRKLSTSSPTGLLCLRCWPTLQMNPQTTGLCTQRTQPLLHDLLFTPHFPIARGLEKPQETWCPSKWRHQGPDSRPPRGGGSWGLTRTLPVSVWADIITPAQSFTEVIQPTSAATASSFSSTGLRVPSAWVEPLLIFWASWQKENRVENRNQLNLLNTTYSKESKLEGSWLIWELP